MFRRRNWESLVLKLRMCMLSPNDLRYGLQYFMKATENLEQTLNSSAKLSNLKPKPFQIMLHPKNCNVDLTDNESASLSLNDHLIYYLLT